MTGGIVIGEFAVNPACVTALRDIQDLLRIFSFPNGAVISEFPGNWIADVKGRAQQLEEPTRKAFLEKVDQLKKAALVRLGRVAEGANWIERARNSHAIRPFCGLLHTEQQGNCLCFRDAVANHLFPEGLREDKVRRDPESMVNAVLPLIQTSERFALIDPFIVPDEYFAKFVSTLIRRSREVRQVRLYIDIHLEHDPETRGPVTSRQVAAFDSWVAKLPEGLTVTVRWWTDSGVGELHPRYLITERGGARFDRGFKIPADMDQRGYDADVSMLTDNMISVIERRYKESYQPLKCLHKEEFKK